MRESTITRFPPQQVTSTGIDVCKQRWAGTYDRGIKITFLSSGKSGEGSQNPCEPVWLLDCQNRFKNSETLIDDKLASGEVTAVPAPKFSSAWTQFDVIQNISGYEFYLAVLTFWGIWSWLFILEEMYWHKTGPSSITKCILMCWKMTHA